MGRGLGSEGRGGWTELDREWWAEGGEAWYVVVLRTGLRYTDVPVFLYGTRTGISFLPYRTRTVIA